MLDDERVKSVHTLLEHQTIGETLLLQQSDRFISMAARMTPEELSRGTKAVDAFIAKAAAKRSPRNIASVMRNADAAVVAVLGPPKRDPSIFDSLAEDVSAAVRELNR